MVAARVGTDSTNWQTADRNVKYIFLESFWKFLAIVLRSLHSETAAVDFSLVILYTCIIDLFLIRGTLTGLNDDWYCVRTPLSNFVLFLFCFVHFVSFGKAFTFPRFSVSDCQFPFFTFLPFCVIRKCTRKKDRGEEEEEEKEKPNKYKFEKEKKTAARSEKESFSTSRNRRGRRATTRHPITKYLHFYNWIDRKKILLAFYCSSRLVTTADRLRRSSPICQFDGKVF